MTALCATLGCGDDTNVMLWEKPEFADVASSHFLFSHSGYLWFFLANFWFSEKDSSVTIMISIAMKVVLAMRVVLVMFSFIGRFLLAFIA